jgi:hypothetical protein
MRVGHKPMEVMSTWSLYSLRIELILTWSTYVLLYHAVCLFVGHVTTWYCITALHAVSLFAIGQHLILASAQVQSESWFCPMDAALSTQTVSLNVCPSLVWLRHSDAVYRWSVSHQSTMASSQSSAATTVHHHVCDLTPVWHWCFVRLLGCLLSVIYMATTYLQFVCELSTVQQLAVLSGCQLLQLQPCSTPCVCRNTCLAASCHLHLTLAVRQPWICTMSPYQRQSIVLWRDRSCHSVHPPCVPAGCH